MYGIKKEVFLKIQFLYILRAKKFQGSHFFYPIV